MYDHKSKREEHLTSGKSGINFGLLAVILIVALVLWQQHPANIVDGTVDSIGGLIGGIFGLIGTIIGGVFGLIGHILGFVFGLLGTILGLVGGIIGLVLGFVGLVLGLVFGMLGFVVSIVVPLAILAVVIKLFSSSQQSEKSKRKNDWNDDGIAQV